MVSRESLLKDILSSNSKAFLLELSTGTGKCRLSIEKVKQVKPSSILIFAPKLVLFDTWKEEFIKWDAEEYLDNITFSTYISAKKLAGKSYDFIIYDEAHRATDNSMLHIVSIQSEYKMALSATTKKAMYFNGGLIDYFKRTSTFTHIKVQLKESIDNDILPTPKIIKMPLSIYDFKGTYYYTKSKSAKIEVPFKDRKKMFKSKEPYKIVCTPYEYLLLLNQDIDYWKKRTMATNDQKSRFRWLSLAGERLKFLARLKNDKIKELIKINRDKRILVFCSDINQTEDVGINSINSRDGQASKILRQFNDGEINHIATCAMLDEGVNLSNCEVGIFAYIPSSDILQIQRVGRLFRHKKPKLVFLYFKDTREEEIVDSFMIKLSIDENSN